MTLTQQQLETNLWNAANALRGPVDPADFKNYVFPVLFWKWLSDTYDYNHELAVAAYGDKLTPEIEAIDFQPFDIPVEHHWRTVARSTHGNKGVRVRRAMDSIAQANPGTLQGVFGDAAFGNESRLPRKHLDNLLNAFDKLTLNPEQVDTDILGGAYEYLLKQFADSSGQKAGEFFTPRSVVHLLVDILDPQPGNSVYDPSCGSGGMLVETVQAIKKAGGNPRAVSLFGQEINLTTSAIARMNLFLHGVEDHKIVRGDTLRNPLHLHNGQLERFDRVIANPPFSLQNWGADDWETDKFSRSFCGLPPNSNGDYAWIQHMIASLQPEGRAAVVLPHGVLFRGGREGAIRQCIVENDQVEAVIGLPANLFYATTIPVCILVLRKNKPADRKGKTLFIDASKRFVPGKNRNDLSDDDVAAIHAAYHEGIDIDGTDGLAMRDVETSEIAANDFDLSLTRYVSSDVAEDAVDVGTALTQWHTARERRQSAENALMDRLKGAGYDA